MVNYSPVGDLTVVSICFVMIILIVCSYIRNSRSFRIFLMIIGCLIVASFSDVIFHVIASSRKPEYYQLGYVIRCFFHAVLFMVFVLFIAYIMEVTRLEKEKKRIFQISSTLIFLSVICVDIMNTVRGTGVSFSEEGIIPRGHNIFMYGYIAFVILIIALLAAVRDRLYRRVMFGFYGSMAISFYILLLQGIHRQSSFTVVTFLYPVIAMLYILHSNPYDAELGAVDSKALQDTVKENYEKKRDFLFMSLYLKEFDEEGKPLPRKLQSVIRRFAADFFKGAMLFQASNGHSILVVQKKRNPDYQTKVETILEEFQKEYEKYQYDYKVVIGESIDELSRKNEYVSFIQNIHRNMPENSIHRINADDIKTFNRTEIILKVLEDIFRKRDLDDPRVLAFCQPVFNLKTQKYDTAEALMRLQLDELGMVFPDQFIPLAEENGYIHALTEIILHKTCVTVGNLLAAGYEVSRISVNVSVLELKDDQFCEDITRIIKESGIPGEKIAIELTESRTDSDFYFMKHKISELREQGIKFYLDDFGTGYSNMERIMELPFDIIKFDRSLVLASETSERSKKLVFNLANLFSELNYSVLYEGVEKEADEKMCMEMSASYLQGYKYSRPMPIEDLTGFFEK